MKYQSREQVEAIGRVGASYDGEKARFLSSFWLYVEPEDRAFTVHHPDGFWEAWITFWMSNEFDDHDKFWDIGANVGYYTMLAATHGLRVVSVEPQKHLMELMHKSAEVNNLKNRIAFVEVALSDEKGEIFLASPGGHSGAGFITHEVPTSEGWDWQSEVVKQYRWDDYFVHLPGGNRHLIKIDAEGAEPKIWEGMKNFRENNEFTMILEWAPSRYENAGQFADELLQYGEVYVVDGTGYEEPVAKDRMLSVRDFEMVVVRNWN
jgi:FkbM family methyltransferase